MHTFNTFTCIPALMLWQINRPALEGPTGLVRLCDRFLQHAHHGAAIRSHSWDQKAAVAGSHHRTCPRELYGVGFTFKGMGRSVTPRIPPSLSGNTISPSKPNQAKEKNPPQTKTKKGNTANKIS